MKYDGGVSAWLADKKKLWKWEGNSLVSVFDQNLAIDAATSPYRVVKKTGIRSQQLRKVLL